MAIIFKDTFSPSYVLENEQVSPTKLWRSVHNGFGIIATRPVSEPLNNHSGNIMYMKPKPPGTNGYSTLSALVLTEKIFKDFDMTFSMRTLSYNRTPKPNPWETAWIMFRYTHELPNGGGRDNHHHYYINLAVDGTMEIGKKDYQLYDGGLITPDGKKHPGSQEQQQFLLYQHNAVSFALKKWFKIRVIAKGRNIKVYIDDVLKADITDDGTIGWDSSDNDRPITYPASETMLTGRIGLYCEDSAVEFDDIVVRDVAGTVEPPPQPTEQVYCALVGTEVKQIFKTEKGCDDFITNNGNTYTKKVFILNP